MCKVWNCAAVVALATIGGCGSEVDAGNTEGQERVAASQVPSCSMHSIFTALAIDTATLSSHRLDTEGLSTEGGEAVEYIDSSGTRKVLVTTFMGETGRLRQVYFFANDQDYAVERTVFRYDRPISEPGARSVVAREKWILYVCGGEPQIDDYVQETQRAMQLLQSLQ